MNTDKSGLALNATTEKIIACAFEVSNTLGAGFLEKVYENALALELRLQGFAVEQQFQIQVKYRDQLVGDYVADLLVNGQVLIELKAVQALDVIHQAQCLNYLRATGLPICLLLNFGRPKLEIKRLAGATK